MSASVDAQPDLCTTVVRFLNLLYSQSRRDTFGSCVIGRGQGTQQKLLPAGEVLEFVPPWLLHELEYVPVDDIRLTVTTSDASGQPVRDCGALFTQIVLEPVFERSAWVVPEATRAAAHDRLRAFPVQPSIVVDAWSDLTAVWALDNPLRFDDPRDRERAEQLQQALAAAVGGRKDDIRVVVPRTSIGSIGDRQDATNYDTLPARSPLWPAIRLPGSRNHDSGESRLVTVALFSDQRVTVDAIAQALESYNQQEPT